jgi:hypothetical protein
MTAPISPGSSGGPVINLSGEVIGVATLYFKEGQNLNFAIPSEKISYLDENRPTGLLDWRQRPKTSELISSGPELYFPLREGLTNACISKLISGSG